MLLAFRYTALVPRFSLVVTAFFALQNDVTVFKDKEAHDRSLEKFCGMDGFKCSSNNDCFFGRRCCKVKFQLHSIDNQHFGPYRHGCKICIFV